MEKKIFGLICLIFVSCGQKSIDKDISKNAQSIDTLISANSKLPIDECGLYYKAQDRLYEMKESYFNDSIYPAAMKNSSITSYNAKFMATLKTYINEPRPGQFDKLATENILFPIFCMEMGQIGAYGFPEYDYDAKVTHDISLEYKLLEEAGYFRNNDSPTNEKMEYFKEIFDSLYKDKSTEFFLYTDKKQVKAELYNFGYYFDECISYYYYPLKSSNLQPKDRPMIGSIYPLDLEYRNFPEIDTLMHRQVKQKCHDCPDSHHLTTTFAKIKGVDNLYFVYADTFPINDKLDTPSRGLIMKMGEKFVYLWYEEVDLFGCPCL